MKGELKVGSGANEPVGRAMILELELCRMVFRGLTNLRREGKARKKRRSMNGNEEAESEYSSDSQSSKDDGDRPKYFILERD